MMEQLGYRAVVFAASDDSKFHQGIWDFDVRSIHCGAALPELAEGFGNIVFYPSATNGSSSPCGISSGAAEEAAPSQIACHSFAVK